MKKITVYVQGKPGDIDAQALVKSVDALLEMLRSVSKNSSSPATVSDLRTSSLVVEIAGVPADVECIAAGLTTVRQGTLPPGWTEKTLNGVLKLEKVSNLAGVSGITVTSGTHSEEIDASLAQSVREVEDSAPRSLGSITGRLYSYANRDGSSPEARMRDEVTGKTVTLYLRNAQAKEVIPLLEKRVTVRGIKTYDAWRQSIVSIRVRGITDATRSRDPEMTLDKGRGLLRDPDGPEIDGVELIRKLRDAS